MRQDPTRGPARPIRAAIISALAMCLAAIAAPHAAAQTGPLILKPWTLSDKPRLAETRDEILYIPNGEVDQTGDDIDVFYWDSSGRIKFDRDDPDPTFWLGYDILTIELGGNPQGLAGGYTDLALQGAWKMGQIGGEWDMVLAGGLGIATDNHFSDAGAIYGLATLDFTRHFSATAQLSMGVNYDGNRTILPDIPLPYAVYLDQASKQWLYYIGLPTSGFVWTPDDHWTISASFLIPSSAQAQVSYEIIDEKLSVFAAYQNTYDAFWVHNADNRRTFYELNRVVAGIRWIWEPWVDLSVGGGYAFDQEFSYGWDSRDTHTIASPSNEPVLYFNLRGTF